MPLSSKPLKEERKGAIRQFYAIVKDNEGQEKKVILARGRLNIGVRKSTIYDYYETLKDAGEIVEEDGLVYTMKTYETLVQERLQTEARKEEQLVKVNSLDAYDLER